MFLYFQTHYFFYRWVPTLNPNDVADRVITAIKKNEKIAIIPGYVRFMLQFKW